MAQRVDESRRRECGSFDLEGSVDRLVWPVIAEERDSKVTRARYSSVAIFFDHTLKREFSAGDDFSELVQRKPDIEIGKYFDVISLLSCNYTVNDLTLVRNNGDQVELKKDAFKGKYLMICCFNVPVFRGDRSSFEVQTLANICSDLYARNPDTFEMIVVPKMHQCDSSLVLNKIGSAQETVTISELKHRIVGLYVFVGGDLLLQLDAIYEECRAKHLEFEVVLVYAHFVDCLDPQASQDKIDQLLLRNNISWWRVPYNDSVSRRLWRSAPNCEDDMLVILGPHDSYVDPFGREVMKGYGIGAFPFTREALIQRELRELQEVTLESLLVYQSRNYVQQQDDRVVPVEQLRNRNILVYFGCLQNPDLYHNLFSWYPKIKDKDSSYEVVFVRRSLDHIINEDNVAEDDAAARSAMPWLVCPFNHDHSILVQERLFPHCRPHDTLVQFGTDGHIRSVEAHLLLQDHGTDAFPFNDNLRQDIIFRFRNTQAHGFMESYK